MGFIKVALIFFCLTYSCWAELVDIVPLRAPKNNTTQEDVESHVKDSYVIGGHKVNYKNPSDPANSTHECCHAIHSFLRIKYKVENGYYLLGNKAFLIKEQPKITLRDVANRIPAENRGGIYKLYLVEQAKYWNNQPLYILDEVTAYLHGTATAIEINQKTRAIVSFEHCLQMYYYGLVCYDMVPEFTNRKELLEFLQILGDRIGTTWGRMEKMGWIDSSHSRWLNLIQQWAF